MSTEAGQRRAYDDKLDKAIEKLAGLSDTIEIRLNRFEVDMALVKAGNEEMKEKMKTLLGNGKVGALQLMEERLEKKIETGDEKLWVQIRKLNRLKIGVRVLIAILGAEIVGAAWLIEHYAELAKILHKG